MSERFIFNKKLNRKRNRKTALVVCSILVLAIVSSVWGKAKAQDIELIDPNAELQSVFSATLTGIDFTRGNAGQGIATISFDNMPNNAQLIESQGQVTVTLPATKKEKMLNQIFQMG